MKLGVKKVESVATTEGGQLTDMIICKDRCSIGATSVIAPNGDVYPCMFTKYPELRLGNLREKSMRSIYKSPLLHELVSCNVDKINACRDCWNWCYCGGGCRGIAFCTMEVFTRTTRMCVQHVRNLLESLA